jgi:aldose 1-epimerase
MIAQQPFGECSHGPCTLYVLKNVNGCEAHVTDLGAAVVRFFAPDRNGKLEDVVLGFDDAASYVNHGAYLGATVGRVANRIFEGKFELEGERYALAHNDPPHHLHGGVAGWDSRSWTLTELSETTERAVLELQLTSEALDQGYPGRVVASVRFELDARNRLLIVMTATVEHKTLICMAHHGYWNLSGNARQTILDHELQLHSDAYTPGDPVVPDGRVVPVAGGAFDFRTAKTLGRDLAQLDNRPRGYDHNFIVRGEPGGMRPVAELYDPSSGRSMRLWADQPGVQLYTGNFLDGKLRGKHCTAYAQYTGVCLETQAIPNAVNVAAWRDQVVFPAHSTYRHVMLHEFGTR